MKRTVLLTGASGRIGSFLAPRLARDYERNGVGLKRYVFPKSADLDHDVIDPTHEKANIELVYPVLLELGLAEVHCQRDND